MSEKRFVFITDVRTGNKIRCTAGDDPQIQKALLLAKDAKDWSDPRCQPLIAAWNEFYRTHAAK